MEYRNYEEATLPGPERQPSNALSTRSIGVSKGEDHRALIGCSRSLIHPDLFSFSISVFGFDISYSVAHFIYILYLSISILGYKFLYEYLGLLPKSPNNLVVHLLTMAPAKTTEIDFTKFYNIVIGEKRSSKEVSHGFNPNTQADLWDVPIATDKDVEEAIQTAKTAFKSWSKTTLAERSTLIKKYAAAIKPYLGELGDLVMQEIGKPVCGANVYSMEHVSHHP